jgi:hypothetical protein
MDHKQQYAGLYLVAIRFKNDQSIVSLMVCCLPGSGYDEKLRVGAIVERTFVLKNMLCGMKVLSCAISSFVHRAFSKLNICVKYRCPMTLEYFFSSMLFSKVNVCL